MTCEHFCIYANFHWQVYILNKQTNTLEHQFSSVTKLCLTLCDLMDCSAPGIPVNHQLLELAQLMSIKLVMPSNHLILCRPLVPFASCLQSFPASGSFPMSQFFVSGGQRIGASASVLPMNIQD